MIVISAINVRYCTADMDKSDIRCSQIHRHEWD